MIGSRNEAFARVAHLFGRLAHVFADREAILERHSLNEDAYRALERRTIEALLGASEAELAHFARAFAEERASLLGLIQRPPPASWPGAQFRREGPRPDGSRPDGSQPPSSRDSAPVVRVEAKTLRQPHTDPDNIDDLMETLHVQPPSRPK
jgi:hypothetical protein